MLDELEQFLKTRRTPDIPDGLSARIISASKGVGQRGPVKLPAVFKAWFDDIQSVFTLPEPAYVVAGLVVFAIGMSVGMSADETVLLSGLSVGDLAAFMEINDSFVVGEWV